MCGGNGDQMELIIVVVTYGASQDMYWLLDNSIVFKTSCLDRILKKVLLHASGIGRRLVHTVLQHCRSIRDKQENVSDNPPPGGLELFLETIACPHTAAAIAL